MDMTEKKARLTPKEVSALTFIAQGFTTAEVGVRMNVMKRTIDYHLGNAYAKLGVHNRVQAINAAKKKGFLPREL